MSQSDTLRQALTRFPLAGSVTQAEVKGILVLPVFVGDKVRSLIPLLFFLMLIILP
jgi:hypothetical protein